MNGTPFKHIQQPNNYSCGIAVAAMITGDTFEQAECALHNIRHLLGTGEGAVVPTGREISIYLLLNRWSDGLMIGSIENRQDEWDNISHFKAEIMLYNPALLIVKSARDEIVHAVLWTGKEVFDPLKSAATKLGNYKIIEWRPLVYHEPVTEKHLAAEAKLLGERP